MTTALVTGISGQDGHYLASLLRSKGVSVVGLSRDPDSPSCQQLREAHPDIRLVRGDLHAVAPLAALLDDVQPDQIYNLAAFSEVGRSWALPELTSEVTGMGALRLLEAVRRCYGTELTSCRIYQASSSEMFGHPPFSPQNEKTRFHPRSPYGVAKVFAHNMAVNYRESYGLHISCGILYNHESVHRGRQFVTRKITLGVAAISVGFQDHLMLGDLNGRRDWGHAEDYVRAMWLMVQQEEPGDYVIATGESHSLRDFLSLAFARAGLDWRRHVRQDPNLLRPAEVANLVGDASKARAKLGWAPTRTFEAIVHELVDADLAAARAAALRG